MRLSLTRVKRRAGRDGGPEEVSRRETLLDGESFRIGRGLDLDITLPDIAVDHHHANLTIEDGQPVITSVAEGKLRIGSKVKRKVVLEHGKPVRIGNHNLTLESPPSHADIAIAVEAVEVPASEKKRERTTLADVLPSKRRLAWLLALPVIALTLAWPLAEALVRPPQPVEDGRVAVLEATPPKTAHPVLTTWSSGPMSVAHGMIGEDCTACHQRPFEMTPDRACLACHADTARHAPVPGFPVAGLDDLRCGSCHKEHEDGAAPIEKASALCTACHAEEGRLRALAPDGDTRMVRDFAANHPDFRVSGGTPLVPEWVKSGGSEGLKFPHDVHLTGRVLAPVPVSAEELKSGPPEGWSRVESAEGPRFRSPEGRMFTEEARADLGCADCHVTEPGGSLMRPIEMERDCAWCHELKIDTLTVARAVPHAQEVEVTAIIRDYYRARALEGGVQRQDAPSFAQRPFGATVLSTGQADIDDALAWAAAEAEKHLVRVFSDEGTDARTDLPAYDVGTGLCAYCHRTEAQDGDSDQPWRVVPARLQRHWMPMARFDHAPHAAMDCAGCHEAATKSKAASDVLMPEIKSCRACHVGEHVAASASSNCVACHDYHGYSDGAHGVLSPDHMTSWEELRRKTERAKSTNLP